MTGNAAFNQSTGYLMVVSPKLSATGQFADPSLSLGINL
jgi:hypothetical protein